MYNFKKSISALTLALTAAGFSLPAHAASQATRAFLENVTPNVDFVDRSSRLVLSNSKDAKVREFARAQAIDATTAANTIYEWSQAGGKSVVAAGTDEAPMQTGRSAAVDKASPVDTRLPRGQEDIDALYGAEGVDLDKAFKDDQRDALTQIQADYQTYIATGDDATLKALAVRELPIVTKHLALLNKI